MLLNKTVVPSNETFDVRSRTDMRKVNGGSPRVCQKVCVHVCVAMKARATPKTGNRWREREREECESERERKGVSENRKSKGNNQMSFFRTELEMLHANFPVRTERRVRGARTHSSNIFTPCWKVQFKLAPFTKPGCLPLLF